MAGYYHQIARSPSRPQDAATCSDGGICALSSRHSELTTIFSSDRLQKTIFAGTIKTVVVWKLDRLSRRQRDGVDLLADWCERGVRVVAVTQQIDLSGAVGRMVASVLFGLAELESEYRRERQTAGIVVAKERGVYRGRQRDTTKASPRRAQELRSRGLLVQEIATALGISRRTALRYLTATPVS